MMLIYQNPHYCTCVLSSSIQSSLDTKAKGHSKIPITSGICDSSKQWNRFLKLSLTFQGSLLLICQKNKDLIPIKVSISALVSKNHYALSWKSINKMYPAKSIILHKEITSCGKLTWDKLGYLNDITVINTFIYRSNYLTYIMSSSGSSPSQSSSYWIELEESESSSTWPSALSFSAFILSKIAITWKG